LVVIDLSKSISEEGTDLTRKPSQAALGASERDGIRLTMSDGNATKRLVLSDVDALRRELHENAD
jgi:hypothetical protein